MDYIKVKNWQKFQHNKQRRPIWIKLYRELLDDRNIHALSDPAFRLLVQFWLLASEDEAQEGILPSIPDIAFRLRKSEEEILLYLQELGEFVYQHDIKWVSSGYQDDTPEKRREREEKKKEESDLQSSSPSFTTNQEGYFWSGKVIKLTEGDFLRWQTSFQWLDLPAELQALDDYYSSLDSSSDWFIRASAALAKKNREQVKEKPAKEIRRVI